MFEDLDEKLQEDPELRKHHQQEKLILDITELIAKQMEKNNINKTRLAELLGASRGYVTQLLDGTTNMTLRTISDVFTALDSELIISGRPLSLEASQTYQYYEAEDLVQTTINISTEDLLDTDWVQKDNVAELAA